MLTANTKFSPFACSAAHATPWQTRCQRQKTANGEKQKRRSEVAAALFEYSKQRLSTLTELD
jgi:hypothetical protein